MSDNRIVLGSPVERGHSDVVKNYEAGANVQAGKAAGLSSAGVAGLYASGAVFGVLGYKSPSGQIAVVEAGKKVGVQCTSDAVPVIGSEEVYVTSAGLFTSIATDNVKVRAKWRNAGLGSGILADTGAAVENCAYIDFLGGLATANVAA